MAQTPCPEDWLLLFLSGQLPLDPTFHQLMLPMENMPTYLGSQRQNTDFLPYNGDGFKLSIPSKRNPSKEMEYPGQVLRYEDNFDSTSNIVVMVTLTDKKSITDYGSPEDFLSKVDHLLGKQAYSSKTDSEGGFDSNAVATANILESSTPVIGGQPYYFKSVLTRMADGDEGGKHQLITASVRWYAVHLQDSSRGRDGLKVQGSLLRTQQVPSVLLKMSIWSEYLNRAFD